MQLLLNCSNINSSNIECILDNKKQLDINIERTYNKFFFYYEDMSGSNLTLNNQTILIDNKAISLIFKPEIFKNQILYADSRILLIKNNKAMANNGYLYILRESKKILNMPNDGFNKYIELNNFISHAGLSGYRPQSTLIAYEEAIRRGYHIVDGDLQFTKDKIPVINKEEILDRTSNGKGILSSKTLKELEELEFGNNKFKGQKILTLENLLKLCKKYDIILDLDFEHIPFSKYFNKNNEYFDILINIINKYNMFNSILFNSGNNLMTITKFQKIKNDISISIAGMNTIKKIKEIEKNFTGSKRIIYNMGGLLNGKTIDEETVNYAINLGKKVKAAKVNDKNLSDKIVNWGVNYITTQYLHPFLMKNNRDYPIKIKCFSQNFLNISECKIDDDIKLKDNEIYDIYYMDKINNSYENINENPIGKFKYINTKYKNKLFYYIKELNFSQGKINLIFSNRIKRGNNIKGIIGPPYDNVAECYLYDFNCKGNNKYYISCKIIKDNKEKVEYEGKYEIYYLENYSLNKEQVNLLFQIKKTKIICFR